MIVVCSYNLFVQTTKVMKIFPNNKQWTFKDSKVWICEKNNAFNEDDVNKEKDIMRDEIRYEDEAEDKLSSRT